MIGAGDRLAVNDGSVTSTTATYAVSGSGIETATAIQTIIVDSNQLLTVFGSDSTGLPTVSYGSYENDDGVTSLTGPMRINVCFIRFAVTKVD